MYLLWLENEAASYLPDLVEDEPTLVSKRRTTPSSQPARTRFPKAVSMHVGSLLSVRIDYLIT